MSHRLAPAQTCVLADRNKSQSLRKRNRLLNKPSGLILLLQRQASATLSCTTCMESSSMPQAHTRRKISLDSSLKLWTLPCITSSLEMLATPTTVALVLPFSPTPKNHCPPSCVLETLLESIEPTLALTKTTRPSLSTLLLAPRG